MPKKPKKPESLVATSSEEMRPALTAENFHEHPDTPSDQLCSFVTNYINSDHVADAPEHDIASAVSAHPNLPTASITDLYNHAMGPDVNNDFPEGKYKLPRGTYGEITQNLLSHKNAAPSIAENFLEQTANSDDYRTMDAHSTAASHPGVSQEFLKNLVTQSLNSPQDVGSEDHKKWAGYKLPASFHEELLSGRGAWEPEEGTMTEEQKANNNRIRKLDQFMYGSYPNAKHDKESLKRATDFYSNHEPSDKHDFQESRSKFIQKQPGLSGNDLEAIVTKAKERGDASSDLVESVYKHPNVSPSFIAKQATSEENENDYNMRGLKDKAISSEKLPEETRKKLIRDLDPSEMSHWGKSASIASALLENENLPAADIEEIFKKGKIDAMYHP